MKKLAFIMAMACLLLLTACHTTDPTVTTFTSTVPTGVTPADTFDPLFWSEYSDYELMELTMSSSENEFRQLSAVWMTAEEWKDYMLDNCEPFRALMLRDSALNSIEEHAQTVINQYNWSTASMRRENFVLLVMAVHSEMKEQFGNFEITFPPRVDQ